MPPVARGRALDEKFHDIAPNVGDYLIFDGLVYPNRSLPNVGFVIVMGIVIAVNLLIGVFFISLGAWPVLVFGGLDILLVWGAFKLSYRQGRLHERIRITANEIWVSRVAPSAHETRWRLQPYWTTVECDAKPRDDTQIRLVSKGKTLILGAFLSPPERVELANALRDALGQATNSARQ